MDDKAAAPRDWLEPPDWWKKWRPLRWLAGLIVALALYSWFGPEGDDPPPPRTAAAKARPAATPADVARAAPPAATAEPTPVPATPGPTTPPRATPAPSAVATATVAPTPGPTDPAEAAIYEEAAPPPGAESEIAAFTRIERDPVPLLGNYRSYMGVDAVIYDLEQAGFQPQLESMHARVPGDVPPRNLDIVTVHQFRHWGVQGQLELQFFNDRLYQAEFEPDEAEPYRNAQRRELPQLKREGSGRSELIQGDLRIASSLDLAVSEVGRRLRTRPFLLWQDRRLLRQRDEWDRRFAERAAR